MPNATVTWAAPVPPWTPPAHMSKMAANALTVPRSATTPSVPPAAPSATKKPQMPLRSVPAIAAQAGFVPAARPITGSTALTSVRNVRGVNHESLEAEIGSG